MKRMFNSDFMERDMFLDLPISAKLLYIYLNLYADDEGFIGSTRKALVMSGANSDDMKVLLAKNLIKELEENDFTKVYLVTDFFTNNSEKIVYNKGFKETDYKQAKDKVKLVNKVYMLKEDYELMIENGIIKEITVTELKKNKTSNTKSFVKPTIEEIREYCAERHNTIDAKRFYDWYEANDWTVKGKPMKSWKNAVLTWESNSKSSYSNQNNQTKDIYMNY